MARRKQLLITERLTQVEAQIVQKEEELKALKAERKKFTGREKEGRYGRNLPTYFSEWKKRGRSERVTFEISEV